MFIWDFNVIFAIFLIVFIGLVIGWGIFYTLGRDKVSRGVLMEPYFKQCLYCGHTYLDYLKHDPSRCPRCKSYHD